MYIDMFLITFPVIWFLVALILIIATQFLFEKGLGVQFDSDDEQSIYAIWYLPSALISIGLFPVLKFMLFLLSLVFVVCLIIKKIWGEKAVGGYFFLSLLLFYPALKAYWYLFL